MVILVLATCSDGTFLSGSADYTIRYWRPSANGFVCHQILTGHTYSVRALATCPDGTFLSGSHDHTIRYWRPSFNGFILHRILRSNLGDVYALTTYPNGAFLSGSGDQTIRYWRPSSDGFVLHQTLKGHTRAVYALATSPDGAFLSASNNTILYWTSPLLRIALPRSADLATAFTQALPVGSLWLVTQPTPQDITVTLNDTLLPDTLQYLKYTLDNLAFALSGITPFTLAFHELHWQLTFIPPNSICQQLILSLIEVLEQRCMAAIPQASNTPTNSPSPTLQHSASHSPTFFRPAATPSQQEHPLPKPKSFFSLSH